MMNRIEERCSELGVNQKWLSEKSGISESAISEIKSGATTPRVDTAIYLARSLGIAVEKLFIVP